MTQALSTQFGSVGAAPALRDRSRQRLSRRQKAAIIVRLLLKEGSELSLEELPEALQVELTHEMGAMRRIDKETLRSVVDEFISDMEDLGMAFPGGLEGALSTLDGAISAKTIRRVRKETGLVVKGDPWKVICGLPDKKLTDILQRESTEIAAVVMSMLPVARSADLLGLLPGQVARRITYAVSTTDAIDPETVHMIGIGIAGQVINEDPKAFTEAPVARLGAILNFSAASTRNDVLTGLDAEDAQFAKQVRKAIFTFADIAERIEGRDVPRIARAVDQRVLVTALAGSTGEYEASAEFILGNMSQRLAAQLRDEVEEMPTTKPKDVEDAMNTIVTVIRDMQQAGEIAFAIEEES